MRPLLFLLAFALSSVVTVYAGGTIAEQRVAASFALAVGRKPTAQETAAWLSRGQDSTVAQLVSVHKAQLQQDPELQRTIAIKAFTDAMGQQQWRDVALDAASGRTYAELMEGYRARLAERPEEYRDVLERAYRRVVRRSVYDEEVAYWRNFGALPYVLLVGCIDDWARRNQPGLMVTTGTPTVSINSVYLSSVRLSPQVAEEGRAVVALPIAASDDFSYASGRTVIAAGAGKIVAGGRIHFAVVGAPNLVAMTE